VCHDCGAGVLSNFIGCVIVFDHSSIGQQAGDVLIDVPVFHSPDIDKMVT
jgi:hypothetical protein